MKLRKLEIKDAPLMLEWMHDADVVQNMQTDFTHKTLSDCENFIRTSQTDNKNLHLAVVDDNNTYMGTVSLKNIENGAAEFAIAARKVAMGKGFSRYAMSEIIRIGFEKLKLRRIYWCVSPENKRAVKFYDKNGYTRIDISKLNISGRGTHLSNSSITFGIKRRAILCKLRTRSQFIRLEHNRISYSRFLCGSGLI